MYHFRYFQIAQNVRLTRKPEVHQMHIDLFVFRTDSDLWRVSDLKVSIYMLKLRSMDRHIDGKSILSLKIFG